MQNTQNSQNKFEKEVQIIGFTLLYSKTYYKATIIKNLQDWHKDKHINKQNQYIELHIYGQLICIEAAKVIKWEQGKCWNDCITI